jgi:Zn-dependent M28 family amino/carboxypeptidase
MRIAKPLSVLLLLILVVGTCLAFVVQPFVQAIPFQAPSVDPKRLEAHVRHLSVDLFPRSHEQSRNLDRAAQYILSEFKAAGGAATMQDVVVQETTHKNVIVRFGPTTGPVLVIGAHYDSHGDANAGAKHPRGYTPDTHTPGADDNASGVAGLIELAHLLGRTQQTRAIELVAYATEEPPHFRTEHMGSAWHARSLRTANRPVELMLSLEMIGYFSDAPSSQHYPFAGMNRLYPDRGNFIALVGKLSDFGTMRRVKGAMAGATDLPVHSINAPPFVQGIDFSDHLNYWHEGFSAFMVTDTSFMRNPHYHKASDTFERLDYVRMAKVVQGVYAVTQQR